MPPTHVIFSCLELHSSVGASIQKISHEGKFAWDETYDFEILLKLNPNFVIKSYG